MTPPTTEHVGEDARTRQLIERALSAELHRSNGQIVELLERVGDTKAARAQEARRLRDQEILARCRAGESLADIGHRLGLTRERVRQIVSTLGMRPARQVLREHRRSLANRILPLVARGLSARQVAKTLVVDVDDVLQLYARRHSATSSAWGQALDAAIAQGIAAWEAWRAHAGQRLADLLNSDGRSFASVARDYDLHPSVLSELAAQRYRPTPALLRRLQQPYPDVVALIATAPADDYDLANLGLSATTIAQSPRDAAGNVVETKGAPPPPTKLTRAMQHQVYKTFVTVLRVRPTATAFDACMILRKHTPGVGILCVRRRDHASGEWCIRVAPADAERAIATLSAHAFDAKRSDAPQPAAPRRRANITAKHLDAG